MEKKVVTSIRIPKGLLRKTQDLRLNVSEVCENALREAVKALESISSKTEHNGGRLSGAACPEQPLWCGRRDSNPGSQAWKASTACTSVS